MIKLGTLWLWSLAAMFAAFTLPVFAQQQPPPKSQPAATPAAPAATDEVKAPERTQPQKQRQAKSRNTGSQPDTVIR